jgi:hypothetical protein
MANRIVDAIDARDKLVHRKLDTGAVTQERLDALHGSLDMALDEWVICQDRKSLAVAGGTLTVDEGMTIYRILGSGPDDFNACTLAQKVVVTQLLAELLERAVA